MLLATACAPRARRSSFSERPPATGASPRKRCPSGRIMARASCTASPATSGAASRSPTTRAAHCSIRRTVNARPVRRRCRLPAIMSRIDSPDSKARGCWVVDRGTASSTVPPWGSWSLDWFSAERRPMSNSGSLASLTRDFERFKREWPRDFPSHVRDTYRIDLSARYLGQPLPHPVGKGSGQLSLNSGQLETDAEAGLAFAVLKTVIAEDAGGDQSMAAWAIHESKMKVERRGAGWTVTWKGRGWDRSFDDYLALVRAARDLTNAGRLLTVPAVKYHLPRLDEPFRDAEY